MQPAPVDGTADRSQRRASYQQARSRETKRTLVQAAMALWRTNGFSKTTVADICRAAGVSKALFYFYFPRKEDVLFEFVVQSEQAAYQVTRSMLDKPYEVREVVAAALASLEADMKRNPPELVVQTIVEGYRRIVGAGTPGTTRPALTKDIFTGLFQ